MFEGCSRAWVTRERRGWALLGTLLASVVLTADQRPWRPRPKAFKLLLEKFGGVDPRPVPLRVVQFPELRLSGPFRPSTIASSREALLRLSADAPASTALLDSRAALTLQGARGAPGLQSEAALAIDDSGRVLIAGYNDVRGLSLTGGIGVSISGVLRSVDGGQTWLPPSLFGGLPVLPSVKGAAVFGDPDIRYDSKNGRWIYASLYQRPDWTLGVCIHISWDDGAHWTSPLEVTPSFVSPASADKEFLDINPATGRILVVWTQFARRVEIRSSFSDDDGHTWSAAQTLTAGDATAPAPRFYPKGGSNETSIAMVAWRQLVDNGTSVGLRNIRVARSTDGGASWGSPIALNSDYTGEDYIVGVDRVNTSPSIDIDRRNGNVYIVYQVNNSFGEGDIVFQRSANEGVSFGAPVLLSPNPGADRAQFYPSVAVDQSNGNVHVIYYDQSPESSGDLLELIHTVSRDGGLSWSHPSFLLGRPFHAGYGNDTSQPNLGDYNKNAAQAGVHHVAATATSAQPRFDEAGPPVPEMMITPDIYYDRLPDSPPEADAAALRLGEVSFRTDCGEDDATLDPGETATFTFPLTNYVSANWPLSRSGGGTYAGVSAVLSTTTPGVVIDSESSAYDDIAPLSTQANTTLFQIKLSDGFVPGTSIDFLLTVTTSQGSVVRPYRQPTGSPGVTTTLLNEDFQSTPSGSLPIQWKSVHGAGTAANGASNQIAWITSDTLMGRKAAYHAETGPPSSKFGNYNTRWERLWAPLVSIPNVAPGVQSYVTFEFDLVYNLEDEPSQKVLAYDGLTLRFFDAGAETPRSVLAEAFAESICTGGTGPRCTGGIKHFPKHLPRDENSNYFQDMSVWSGNSKGVKHVSIKLPGEGTRDRKIQPRFEYTEDDNAVCSEPPCGVSIANVVLSHIASADGSCLRTGADLAIGKGATAETRRNGELTYNITVRNLGPLDAADVMVTDTASQGQSFLSNAGDCTTSFPCNLGTIPARQMRTIRSTFKVDPNYIKTSVQNSTTVTSSTFDPDLSNNSATVVTVVNDTEAHLSIQMVGPLRVAPGATGDYTITVQNKGPTNASDVILENSPQNGLSFRSSTGACNNAFPCKLETLTVKESRAIVARYALSEDYKSRSIQNTVSVSSSSPDPTPGSNTFTVNTPVDLPVKFTGCNCQTTAGAPMVLLALALLGWCRRRRS